MNTHEITGRLMKILEVKLAGKVEDFNANNLTYTITNDILENLFAKCRHDLQSAKTVAPISKKELTVYCLEASAHLMTNESKSLITAFTENIKATQKKEIQGDCIKLGEYLIGALPYLIEILMMDKEFIEGVN